MVVNKRLNDSECSLTPGHLQETVNTEQSTFYRGRKALSIWTPKK